MKGHLAESEPHPSARIALDFLRSVSFIDGAIYREALASNALEGNRLAEVCLETWRRLDAGEPVSDRYLMGLAWMVWAMEEKADPYWIGRG